MFSHKFFRLTFYSVCMLASISMLVFVTIRFYNDGSMTSLDFQSYHNREQDIYPSISFCLSIEDSIEDKIWYKTSLGIYETYKRNQNYHIASLGGLEDYVRFLLGNDFSSNQTLNIEEILDIKYDDVTIDLREYVKLIKVESADEVLYEWPKNQFINPMVIGYRHGLRKCISLDILDEVLPGIKGYQLWSTDINFDGNNSIFFNKNSGLQMEIFMHYPNQLIRGIKLDHEALRKSVQTFRKEILVDNTEVIRRRNTRTSTCNEYYKQDDEMILKALALKAGCRPTHWPVDESYPIDICTKVKQMREVLTPSLRVVNSKFLEPFPPPCQQIQTISYYIKDIKPPPPTTASHPLFEGYESQIESFASSPGNMAGKPDPPNCCPCQSPQKTDRKTNNEKDDSFLNPKKIHGKVKDKSNFSPDLPPQRTLDRSTKSFRFVFQNPHYKEISHVQSFGMESWIGNAGGYIGLFLGVAIWQAPDFIEYLWRKFKSLVMSI